MKRFLLLAALPFQACNCDPPPPECPPGESGCPCDDGACDGALQCIDDVCRAGTPPVGLRFPADAAGCEILLSETAGQLTVAFGDGTRGTAIREAPKVAVAVTKQGDAALSATITGGFTLVSSRCVDAAGAAVAGTVTE